MRFVYFLDKMAATVTATVVPTMCSPTSSRRRSQTKIALASAYFSKTTSLKRAVLVRASEPQTDDLNTINNDPNRAFTSQEDLNYLWKLVGGSVLGAAVIKYGSILFPEVTRPNIFQALIMISTPVFIAIGLLLKQSCVER